MSVLRQIVGLVLEATGLVAVAYLGKFIGYELLGGSGGEVAVVGGAVCYGGDVSVDGLRVFVIAEGAVDSFFPGERMGPDVRNYPGGAPFGVSMLA